MAPGFLSQLALQNFDSRPVRHTGSWTSERIIKLICSSPLMDPLPRRGLPKRECIFQRDIVSQSTLHAGWLKGVEAPKHHKDRPESLGGLALAAGFPIP